MLRVENVSKETTEALFEGLFSCCGPIASKSVFKDKRDGEEQLLAFVAYSDAADLKLALQLNQLFFIDRVLAVEEVEAIPPGLTPGEFGAPVVLPPAAIAQAVTSPAVAAIPGVVAPITVVHVPGSSAPVALNPLLAAANPTLSLQLNQLVAAATPNPAATDPNKAEEIKRTAFLGNLPPTVREEELIDFFKHCGPIKYVRVTSEGTSTAKYAFIEFTDETGVNEAVKLNGSMFQGRPVKATHSKHAIAKPAAQDSDVNRAIKKVDDAEARLRALLEGKPEEKEEKPDTSTERRRRSRSPSPRRGSRSPPYRRRSPSPPYRRGRHSPDRYRREDYHRSRDYYDRDRRGGRSYYDDRDRERDRDRSSRHGDRERDRDRDRPRDEDEEERRLRKEKERREKDKDKERDKDKDSDKDKDKDSDKDKDKEKDKAKDKDKEKEEEGGEKDSREDGEDDSSSPRKAKKDKKEKKHKKDKHKRRRDEDEDVGEEEIHLSTRTKP